MSKHRLLSDADIEQIAILMAEHMMPQADIAEHFQVSKATIARAVQDAVEDGLLERKLDLRKEVSEENRNAVRTLLNISSLEKNLRELEAWERKKRERKKEEVIEHFQELHVFDSGNPQGSHDEHIRNFARPMAKFLSKQIVSKNLKYLGLSWGRALQEVLNSLKETMPSPPRTLNQVYCIPIAGSPPDAEQFNKTSSANLAGAFSRLLNGRAGESSTFSVLAWIPAKFSEEQASVIRSFFFTSPAYEKAFADGGFIQKLECVITSVGAINNFSGKWLEAAAQATDLSVPQFSALTVGNIAGCFLPHPDSTVEDRKVIDDVNSRWLGIQLEDLQRCAQRRKVPGVVVIAIGKEKAAIVLEAIKHGLVNTLCCDTLLKVQLEELCTSRLKESY